MDVLCLKGESLLLKALELDHFPSSRQIFKNWGHMRLMGSMIPTFVLKKQWIF